MKESYIIPRKKVFFHLALYLLFVTLLLIISIVFKMELLSIVFGMLTIAPVLLMKTILNRYSSKVLINIDELPNECIRVILCKNKEHEAIYPLAKVVGYQIKFPTRRFVSFSLYLSSKKRVEYTFLTEQKSEEQIDAQLLIDTLHNFISKYNLRQPKTSKIIFVPSFFASKKGLFILIALSTFWIIAGCIWIMLKASFFPVFLFLGLMIIFQIIARRAKDISFYNKMIETG